jgi:NAD dependent epimerase/dehydratase family enzyme
METILITGGTGLLGTALGQALLEKGYRVIILTRKIPAANEPADRFQYALWSVEQQTIDLSAIGSADHIIHLAGMNLPDKRWTAKIKNRSWRAGWIPANFW